MGHQCPHIQSFIIALKELEKTQQVVVSAEGYDNPYLDYYCQKCKVSWDESELGSAIEQKISISSPSLSEEPKCRAQIVFGTEFLDLQSWSPGCKLKDILSKENRNFLGMDAEANLDDYHFVESHPPTGFMGTYLMEPASGKLSFLPCSAEEEIVEGCQYRIRSRSRSHHA